ncbi:MAG TPA: ComEC/Rec2 family competence protein [Patescibacteria group bacterium]|nr:ComEC/Rec2 family competence protein [Patescibacteria group bacterium]
MFSATRRIKRPILVIAACLSLFAGTGLAHRYLLADARWLWVVLPVFCFYARRQTWVTLLCVCLLFAGVGWWRGSAMMRSLAAYAVLSKQSVTLVGRATEDGVYGDRSQMVFSMDHVRVTYPRSLSLPGNVAVAGFGMSAVYRGDEVQVTGKLYPRRGNVQAGVSFAELRVLVRGNSPIDVLRRKFAAGLLSAVPEPLASFGLGLLIGQRSTLPPDVAQTLVMVGLTHIIAVSGYNLTIIIEAARRLFGGRSKFQTLAACLALMACFLLLTGNSPSIVRAGIISTLSIFSWYYGRTVRPLVLLLTAAAITIAANPLYLWGNVSWYLSFLAFFGVVLVAPVITRRVYGSRELKLLAKMVIESLCAEAMTLPYVLYIFGQVSTVSLLANVLVAVLVPLAMLLCTVAGLAGMLLPSAAGWVAWPARLVLRYMLDAASLISRVPHAFLERIGFSFAQLMCWYVALGFLLVLEHYKTRPKHGILTEKNRTETEGV